MIRWEYKLVSPYKLPDEPELNALGEEGWEMIGPGIFKRPKKPAKKRKKKNAAA
jgi:hypothetical protein